jgi:hypothetical protein
MIPKETLDSLLSYYEPQAQFAGTRMATQTQGAPQDVPCFPLVSLREKKRN